MEVISHEYYVSLEVAKLLKEAGFDWHVESCWDLSVDGDKWLNYDAIYPNNFRNDNEDIIYAPTLDVAQRWLREVKDVEVNILCVYIGDNKKYSYVVFRGKYNHEIINEGFDNYEEAQEAGIKKYLTGLLHEGN